jgi:hypothetical protein
MILNLTFPFGIWSGGAALRPGEDGAVGRGAEDAQADQTHFLERTVADSPRLGGLSMG